MIIKDRILQHKLIPSQGKLMALDLGTKRIGVATCDYTQTISSPMTIINRKNLIADCNKILNIIQEYSIKSLIIGFPTHMDGTKIQMTDLTINFAKKIDEYLQENNHELPIIYQDERLTSFEAEQIAKTIKSRKNKKHFDDIAATIILEDFLLNSKINC